MDTNFEKRLSSIEERLEALERLLKANPTPPSAKRISAKEFLLGKTPKSISETVFLLGYYLEKVESKETFGIEDLKKIFKSAKIPQPKNMNDLVNKNVSKGYFMESDKTGGKKGWTLTATGERLIEKSNNE